MTPEDARNAAKAAADATLTDDRLISGAAEEVLQAHRERIAAAAPTRPTHLVDAFGNSGQPESTGYTPWTPRCSGCGRLSPVLTFDGTGTRSGLCDACRDDQAAARDLRRQP